MLIHSGRPSRHLAQKGPGLSFILVGRVKRCSRRRNYAGLRAVRKRAEHAANTRFAAFCQFSAEFYAIGF